MERFIQHDTLFIRHFTTVKWPFPLHNHNHFELIFIHSGSGYHQLNGDRQPYQDKSLFLLAPEDYHLFEVEKETEFSVLKFSNSYLSSLSDPAVKNEWNKLIDHLLAISAAYDSCLVESAEELNKIDQLMRLIVLEWEGSLNSANEIVFYLIRSVFALIKKNAIHHQVTEHSLNGDLLMELMDYIHVNIQNPDQLKIAVLSARFNYSANHLNVIFKQQMGVSLKTYVSNYKFKLIENRLKFSKLMIKEISNEFGFTDLSHFNKFLKNQSGYSPKDIRTKV